MSRKSVASSKKHSHRSRGGSWFARKLRRIRESRQAQRQLQQLIVIIAAVLIAFILGFYFFGPSFSSSGE